MRLTELDVKILTHLAMRGAYPATYREIAEAIESHINTISDHIKRLRDAGLIVQGEGMQRVKYRSIHISPKGLEALEVAHKLNEFMESES